jgi:PAS domain-containing protein
MYKTPYFQTTDAEELIALFSSIFNTSYDGLFICDKNGYPLLYNEAVLKIFGMSADFINSYGSIFGLIEKSLLPNSDCFPFYPFCRK